jgi:hypothetical protein
LLRDRQYRRLHPAFRSALDLRHVGKLGLPACPLMLIGRSRLFNPPKGRFALHSQVPGDEGLPARDDFNGPIGPPTLPIPATMYKHRVLYRFPSPIAHRVETLKLLVNLINSRQDPGPFGLGRCENVVNQTIRKKAPPFGSPSLLLAATSLFEL